MKAKLRKLLVFALCGASLAGCREQPPPQRQARTDPVVGTCNATRADGTCEEYSVSLVNLIASPRQYHGRHIAVQGYFTMEFESQGLYLSRDDAVHYRGMNAIWVNVPDPRWQQPPLAGEAFVRGVFNADQKGHLNAFAASIDSAHVDWIERDTASLGRRHADAEKAPSGPAR